MAAADTNKTLLLRLSDYSGQAVNEIRSLNDEEKLGLVRGLRINDLKDIARYFKANGYSTIAMTGNKQHFIDLMIKLWKGEIIQDNVSRNILPVEPHTGRQKLHQPAHLLQSSARNGVPIPSHPMPAQPIAAPKALPQQSLPHVYNEIKSRMIAILNTPEKVQVYNILCGYPGIKKEEILTVLSVWPPSTVVNPDEVMLKIIAKRQTEESQLSMDQRMENEQMDLAVIASEEERDLAKIRKRQKLEDFKVKFEHSLLLSEELSTSCLLHGLLPPSNPPTSLPSHSSSSSSSSSSQAAVIDLSIDDDDDDEGGYDKMKIDRLRYDGCLIVKQVVVALDRNCPSMHASSSSSSSSSSSTSSSEELSFASLLRKSLTNLLLTEVDCIKKFHRQSYPYIIKMGQKIDRVMQIFSQEQSIDVVRDSLATLTFSTKIISSSGQSSKQALALQKIIEVLDHNYRKFSRGLYKMPTDGHQVPVIIRAALDEVGLKLTLLDEDGVEEIHTSDAHPKDEAKVSKKRPASAMNELSDSSASSWPEEEDDDDYDGY